MFFGEALRISAEGRTDCAIYISSIVSIITYMPCSRADFFGALGMLKITGGALSKPGDFLKALKSFGKSGA